MKPKKCKNPDCRKPFTPQYNSLQAYCSPLCAKKCQKKKVFKPIPKQSKSGRERKLKEVDYYKMMWRCNAIKGKCYCEECDQELLHYNAKAVSHILTRQAHPKLALHPLNSNILCYFPFPNACHEKWETGDRKSMKIYQKNQERIEKLLEIENKM